MLAPKILVSALVAFSLFASTAAAQQPLMTQINGLRHGNTFRAGTAASDIYTILVEPVNSSSGQVQVVFTTTGGYTVQDRALRWPKEELHYNAVVWRGVGPGTYLIEATVSWPDGIGAVTGDFYPQGSTVEQFVVTITP